MLKCKIIGKNLVNGTEQVFDVLEGAVFIENYNETLDSGTIILPQLTQEIDIEPFDVVQVSSSNNTVSIRTKRMCVDSYTCKQVSLDPAIYEYEIKLFSETKLLEGILLPSLAITRLVDGTPRKVYEYLQQYIDEYGPKLNSNDTLGAYGNKYSFGCNIKDANDTVASRFGNINAIEMQWNEPTLREVLTDLMMVNDCIPVLRNNVIDFIDISQSYSEITDEQKASINYIITSQSSQDYVSEIKTKMQNATNDNTSMGSIDIVRVCERITFRNYETYLLNSENVKIETAYPIWKLIYANMYFDASGQAEITRTDQSTFTVNLSTRTAQDIYVDGFDDYNLCLEYGKWKTKDVYYAGFNTGNMSASSNYQNTCLYWKRGSKGIHNFEAKTNGKFLWINTQTSVLELLINGVDAKNAKRSALIQKGYELYPNASYIYIETLNSTDWKTVTFEVWYEALAEHCAFAGKGTLPTNKRQVVDNQTQSYVNSKRMGMLEYLKANRLGNKVKLVNGRYETNEISIPDLAQKINGSIIFEKQIAVYDNYISVNYRTTDNYVLRDYYTGVKSKLRSWRILEGEEAFVRADNLKFYVNSNISSANGNYIIPVYSTLQEYLTRFKYCIVRFNTKGNVTLPQSSVIKYKNQDKGIDGYQVEFQKCTYGNSVLFTFRLYDNAIVGKYVADNAHDIGNNVKCPAQKDCKYVDDDGENIGGYIEFYETYDMSPDVDASVDAYNYLYPGVNRSKFSDLRALIPFSIKKDNKEITQITVQIEMNNSANDMWLGKR